MDGALLMLFDAKHLQRRERKNLIEFLCQLKMDMNVIPVTLPVVCVGIDNDPSSRPSTGLSTSSMASDALKERRVIAARIFNML